VLLAIDALAYLLYGFADLLVPGFAARLVPLVQLPALVGEGTFCVWLLIVGVRVGELSAAADTRCSFATEATVDVSRPIGGGHVPRRRPGRAVSMAAQLHW
jgi:hypothetical protein